MQPRTVIAIFCYRRTDTLRQTLAALLKNPECADMDAIFFCDGYKGGHDKEDVLKTREYVATVRGFKKTDLCYRERNYAAGANIYTAINYLSQHYDQFIMVEDDVVFTPNGIRFLLDALAFYKDSPSVFAVTGYCFPLQTKRYKYDSVMHGRFCSYGWASWKNRFTNISWDAASSQRIIDDTPHYKSKLNEEGKDLFRRLRKQAAGKLSTYDIQIQAHMVLHGLKVVYPVVSKLKNVGFDENATHTYGINFMESPLDKSDKREFAFCDAGDVQPELVKQLRKPYRLRSLIARKMYNAYLRYTALARRKFLR